MEIAQRFFALKWVTQICKSRAVRIIESGQRHLSHEIGLVWAAWMIQKEQDPGRKNIPRQIQSPLVSFHQG